MTMPTTGWGASRWGADGWGSPSATVPRLVQALAVSENAVQLTFNVPIYWSGLLDSPDASSRKRYSFASVAGTVGQDGTAPKPIGCAAVALRQVPGLFLGQIVVLTTDRPMTPSPAGYVVTCNGLFASDGVTPLVASSSSAPFESVYKVLQRPQVASLQPRGDVAMPQNGDAVASGSVGLVRASQLGCFVVVGGDYASQDGLVEYRERLYRRIVSVLDSFAHLAGKGYGAGLLQYCKQLGSSRRKTQLLASIERQASLEPETVACAAKYTDGAMPGFVYIVLLARTKFGRSVKLTVPVTAST